MMDLNPIGGRIRTVLYHVGVWLLGLALFALIVRYGGGL